MTNGEIVTIPLCHKCASAELKSVALNDVTLSQMVGCKECDATSYEEACSMCPLINEDVIDV